jgi:predicted ATPase
MEREHSKPFDRILKKIAARIPSVRKTDTEKTADGRLLLRFNDRGFQHPFYALQVSDGTLEMFAYLLLPEDPTPPPFLCVEAPENGLYQRLLEQLAKEFREHETSRKGGSKVFVITRQPWFVDGFQPTETWILEKGQDGFAAVRRASDDEVVVEMVKQGLLPGSLWYSQYLDNSDTEVGDAA